MNASMQKLFSLRPYEKSDEKQVKELILQIQREEFGVPVTLEDQPDLNEITDFYQSGNGNFWVAVDQEVVGTIALRAMNDHQFALRKMFVHRDYRGKSYGVAQKLLETAFTW
jgi:N-acetylglutamate synthase-like GNAT family acetyltransferase